MESSTQQGGRGSLRSSRGGASRSNAELVGIALAGGAAGQEAWNELVRRHSKAVWRVAWSFRMATADREDVFQATWIRALERLGQLREPERLAAWLMSIARHEALAVVRRAGKLVPSGDVEDGVQHSVDAEGLEREERYRVAAAALARLGPECRELIRLLTVEGMTYHDIEEIMGWAPGGTSIRRARCLDRVRSSAEVRHYLRELRATEEGGG